MHIIVVPRLKGGDYMPRAKMSEAQKAKNKKMRDAEYNASRLIDGDGNKQTYSAYLKSKGTKQLKLTLTEAEYAALDKYTKQQNKKKPQEVLKEYIQREMMGGN